MILLPDVLFQLPAYRQVHIAWMLLDREFRETVELAFYSLEEVGKTPWNLEKLITKCYEEYRERE